MDGLIGTGQASEVFDYGENRVLKLFRKEYASMADHEYAIAKVVDTLFVGAPKLYGRVLSEGRTGIIYEQYDGQTMMERLEKNPMAIRRYAHMMAAAQYKIHQRTVTPQSLPMLRPRLSKEINSIWQLSDGVKDATLRKLFSLSDGDRVCHYDFMPKNIIMDGETPYVISWSKACRAEPFADVCKTTILLGSTTLPEGVHPILGRAILNFRASMNRQYLAEYLRLADAKEKAVYRWMAPIAASMLAGCSLPEEKYLTDMVSLGLEY